MSDNSEIEKIQEKVYESLGLHPSIFDGTDATGTGLDYVMRRAARLCLEHPEWFEPEPMVRIADAGLSNELFRFLDDHMVVVLNEMRAWTKENLLYQLYRWCDDEYIHPAGKESVKLYQELLAVCKKFRISLHPSTCEPV